MATFSKSGPQCSKGKLHVPGSCYLNARYDMNVLLGKSTDRWNGSISWLSHHSQWRTRLQNPKKEKTIWPLRTKRLNSSTEARSDPVCRPYQASDLPFIWFCSTLWSVNGPAALIIQTTRGSWSGCCIMKDMIKRTSCMETCVCRVHTPPWWHLFESEVTSECIFLPNTAPGLFVRDAFVYL